MLKALNRKNLKKTKAYPAFIENLKPKTYNLKLPLRLESGHSMHLI